MDHTTLCKQAADEIAAVNASKTNVLVGFDGFVDSIIDIVGTRTSNEEYERIPTIADYGQRICAVAGRSTNLERVIKQRKLGGNGPIMANALLGHNVQLTYAGILGGDSIDPIFQKMTDRTHKIINLGPPCATDAFEFDDGKIMMTMTQPLEAIDYQMLLDVIGEDELKNILAEQKGVATVNWTMTIGMTKIWEALAEHILPGLYPEDQKPWFFVDLCDPAKRTDEDLLEAITALQHMNKHVKVCLGLNEEEARQVLEALGGTWNEELSEIERAEYSAQEIHKRTNLANIVTHFVKVAACADDSGSWGVDGFFTAKPKLTTGAGDNFNAGYFSALLMGLSPEACLISGTATSGYYVRNALSPLRDQLITFLREWTDA